MSSSNFASFLCLLAFSLHVHTGFGADPLFLFHLCSTPENFTANGPCESNLNKLAGYLYYQAPSTGFGSEIRKRCPYNKAAIIWYDNCLFKYSNKEFFGQIDNGNKFYMRNVKVVSEPVTFNGKTKELLTQLANKVQATPKLYKTGEMELGESTKLYGLVQCTRDLSSAVCKKCLDGIIGELPSCCDGKEGGRVVSGSCNFRYEIYPFVNA
ncbi:hypothetical protein D5086_015438 [Populus alba]|uniref:Uncharacterized protein n=3 Tax=Populus TaxID=3689 RepID=A0ACC4C1U1_POPAL|nr:hypothetical protein NC653_019485 [Populus alba x Populus x berolinensis]TKR91041.1 hypothetical protein D5086_0000227590 [Populus alba]